MPLPLCSGALVPSLVCVYLPGMCSLYCQLHSLLMYMDRFDVVLTLVSLVSHCMWCTSTYVTLIRLRTYWPIPVCPGSLTSCLVGSRWGTLESLSVFSCTTRMVHALTFTVEPWSACMAVSIGGETLFTCPHSECPTSLYAKCCPVSFCLPGHHLLLTRLCWCHCDPWSVVSSKKNLYFHTLQSYVYSSARTAHKHGV